MLLPIFIVSCKNRPVRTNRAYCSFYTSIDNGLPLIATGDVYKRQLIDLERYFLPRSFLLFANYTNPDFLNIIGIITKEEMCIRDRITTMTKLTLEQQELLFANDCKLINLRYEDHGYTGTEKWAIVTELAEEELWVKYPDVIRRYTCLLYTSP